MQPSSCSSVTSTRLSRSGVSASFAVPDRLLSTSFAHILVNQYNDEEVLVKGEPMRRHWVFRTLGGQVVHDLGGGPGQLQAVAAECRASEYNCVDLNPYAGNKLVKCSAMQSRRFIADMLEYLEGVPSGSGSVFMSGVDQHIIRDSAKRWAITQEIARVVSPTGIALFYETNEMFLSPALSTTRVETDGGFQFSVQFRANNPHLPVVQPTPRRSWWHLSRELFQSRRSRSAGVP